MRVTRSHTLAMPLRVAAIHSVYKLTGLSLTTLGLFTRHCAILSTDAFLHTLAFRIEDVSFPVVLPIVGAATVSHRHAGIPT